MPLRSAFRYWRPAGMGLIEAGLVQGRDVALPSHFHEEDQITFVLAGRRLLVIGEELTVLEPGHGVVILAGTPHHSLFEPEEVLCINLYAAPGSFAGGELVSDLGRSWRKKRDLRWADLADIVEGHRRLVGAVRSPVPSPLARGEAWPSVGEAAAHAGMSREGFSRKFRRLYGIPPHALWHLAKLNDARRLLRAGHSIATVAAEAGFADQSHLGRCFRRAFGVTPGRYKAGLPGSHPF
ncbi:helix-turn-helix domain-containing protein [Pendulispora albinea]|uniref:AraC family transcriptional regulator n=1 Tax=Pendulispora albinea TaxID=2741071 RepID=A0ABZ2M780_9BACT